ncbi:MAG: hypothetical protein WD116_02660 [Chloroflexota bacterium]
MARKRLFSIAMLVALLTGMLGLQASVVTGKNDGDPLVLEFGTMVGVTTPFRGAANAIRGVPGAGADWVLGSAKGELTTSGHLEIKVGGLVLLNGNNPQANFQAIVSCLTSANLPINVATGPFPATIGLATNGGGNATIEIDLATLPHPCIAPIVFVTNGAGTAWFAVTGG